jgi:hypothetical protein
MNIVGLGDRLLCTLSIYGASNEYRKEGFQMSIKTSRAWILMYSLLEITVSLLAFWVFRSCALNLSLS